MFRASTKSIVEDICRELISMISAYKTESRVSWVRFPSVGSHGLSRHNFEHNTISGASEE